MQGLAFTAIVAGIIAWAAFVAACTAHAVYYWKASRHIPPRWPAPPAPQRFVPTPQPDSERRNVERWTFRR